MLRRLCLVFVAFMCAACALPALEQPTPVPATATLAPIGSLIDELRPTLEAGAPTSASLPTEDLPPETTVTTAPTDEVVRPEDLDDPARIAAAQPEARDLVELAEAFDRGDDIPDVARSQPLDVQVGDIETFWVADSLNHNHYTVTAELRYAGPVALMYVDTSVEVAQAAIERSAKEFEQRIYPRTRELFGEERSPGIDGDPRLTILNTPLSGAGGYFSSNDGVVKAVNRFSNEREMFVIGINSYPLGDEVYGSTLAHELQHMIHEREQVRSPSWFNEGMSTLAEDLNGYVDHGSAMIYLAEPDVQLTTWSGDAAQTGQHYGTSQLFMRYFHEHYGGDHGLEELIEADAGNNLEAFGELARRKRPDITSFADLYADWAVANVINDPDVDDGRYAYQQLPDQAALTEVESGEVRASVSQFGADNLGVLEGPLELTFDGADAVGLTGALPEDGRFMWWSNRGDESVETLTRAFDLTSVQQATLEFSAWYEIELDYDYAFVSVSTDDGATWTTLPGQTTTNDDPQGQNFGNGLTGVSGAPGVEPNTGTRGRWLEERMDLTPFAGKRILLRFWLIHDAAYNTPGLLIDDIRIPELGYRDSGEAGDGGWEAQGFVRTTGVLAQSWALRLIRAHGDNLVVERVAVDHQGRASVRLDEGERGVLVIMGTTPFTTEPAQYTYTVNTP